VCSFADVPGCSVAKATRCSAHFEACESRMGRTLENGTQ
jgi:hypothetical protein